MGVFVTLRIIIVFFSINHFLWLQASFSSWHKYPKRTWLLFAHFNNGNLYLGKWMAVDDDPCLINDTRVCTKLVDNLVSKITTNGLEDERYFWSNTLRKRCAVTRHSIIVLFCLYFVTCWSLPRKGLHGILNFIRPVIIRDVVRRAFLIQVQVCSSDLKMLLCNKCFANTLFSMSLVL